MLDACREQDKKSSAERMSSVTHRRMSDQFAEDLFKLYRPDENHYHQSVELVGQDVINENEKESLKFLNAGNFDYKSQFSRLSYQKTEDGVVFDMIHPSLTYLQSVYDRMETEPFVLRKELNTSNMVTLNNAYQTYNDKKQDIDTILSKVYTAHGNTLDITVDGSDSNKLVQSENLINFSSSENLIDL